MLFYNKNIYVHIIYLTFLLFIYHYTKVTVSFGDLNFPVFGISARNGASPPMVSVCHRPRNSKTPDL